jgi:hypothetical protein
MVNYEPQVQSETSVCANVKRINLFRRRLCLPCLPDRLPAKAGL